MGFKTIVAYLGNNHTGAIIKAFLKYKFYKRITRALTLRQSYVGEKFMGIKLYKSSGGEIFLVLSFCFIIFIK